MRSLVGIFGRSPFAPLKHHLDLVAASVDRILPFFMALQKGDQSAIIELAEEISQKEHEADIAKNDIRNHLPRSLFLPLDRSTLLDMVSLQDAIADTAEDIARISTLKPLLLFRSYEEKFLPFLQKNLAAFATVYELMKDLHELFESSFGGIEGEKVKQRAERVAFLEHEADLLQHQLLESMYRMEEEMDYRSFYLWQKIIEKVSSLSNLSENLGNRVRTTVEVR